MAIKRRHKKMARTAWKLTGWWMTDEMNATLVRWRKKFKSFK